MRTSLLLPLPGFLNALLLAGLLLSSPLHASGRSSISRIRRMVQAQQKQAISNLQKQLQQAQTALQQAETQANSLASDVQSAQMTLQAAKTKVEDGERESHEIVRKIHELEEEILAQQAPDSAYGKARQALEQTQQALDAQMHQILNLPPHSGNFAEEDRLREYAHLSSEQRNTLKANEAYQQASEAVREASAFLASVRRETLGQDRRWEQAQQELKDSHERVHTSQANQRVAGRDAAAVRQKYQLAMEQAAGARQIIMEMQSQLLAMGAKPAAPTTKK